MIGDKIMRKKILILTTIIAAFVFIYIGSYIIFRNTHIEVWQKNGRSYVIFPEKNKIIYYFYRPITYVDAKMTGMGFHIGAHE